MKQQPPQLRRTPWREGPGDGFSSHFVWGLAENLALSECSAEILTTCPTDSGRKSLQSVPVLETSVGIGDKNPSRAHVDSEVPFPHQGGTAGRWDDNLWVAPFPFRLWLPLPGWGVAGATLCRWEWALLPRPVCTNTSHDGHLLSFRFHLQVFPSEKPPLLSCLK